jgi:hypothetical protein
VQPLIWQGPIQQPRNQTKRFVSPLMALAHDHLVTGIYGHTFGRVANTVSGTHGGATVFVNDQSIARVLVGR